VAPDRRSGLLHLAGHPPPVLIGTSGAHELRARAAPPLGVVPAPDWPATKMSLDGRWAILLYTDGLVEGRVGAGHERLGSAGLIKGIEEFAARERHAGREPSVELLLDSIIGRAQQLNGGDLDDDVAMLALRYAQDG
jgi:serine phosphatase RsbU (regulator of sigma subunit)